MAPRVSVIVRSYNRIASLCELLENLLIQDHDSFEVIVVEQSVTYEEKDWLELQRLNSDKRIKILKYNKPLGGPAARNEGVQKAQGEMLIFVDDDDLPASDQWVKQHEKAFEDKQLIGFTGRHVSGPKAECPYIWWMRWFIRKRCMSYSWLKTPYTFARFDEDVKSVEWLHGTNSSVRRAWALKAGLWDTEVKSQDEHSFAFKLKPLLKNGYRLDFRKEPELIRRLDIKGGMGKRSFSISREFMNNFDYLTKIVYKYNTRLRIISPVHFIWIVFKCLKYSIRGS